MGWIYVDGERIHTSLIGSAKTIGVVTITKGHVGFIASAGFLKGTVVEAESIPEALRELATSIEVLDMFSKKESK